MSRLETRATQAQAVALHGVLIEQFIASHKSPPSERVLDIDASDVPLHVNQELSEFQAYYDHHCYLPLNVFCGQAMLVRVLRRGRIVGAKNAAALIKLLAPGCAKPGPRLGSSCVATRVPPPTPAALVRTLGRKLHRRPGAQRATGGDRAVR